MTFHLPPSTYYLPPDALRRRRFAAAKTPMPKTSNAALPGSGTLSTCTCSTARSVKPVQPLPVFCINAPKLPDPVVAESVVTGRLA